MATKTKSPKLEAEIDSMLKKIEYHKTEIGKHRDALREMFAKAESICENCDTAIGDLQRAADALSELL